MGDGVNVGTLHNSHLNARRIEHNATAMTARHNDMTYGFVDRDECGSGKI